MTNLKRFAFTLAEVLIVLGILGVVAEMTIPTIINSTERSVQATQLKKFYTEFQAGMKLYMADIGCNDLICADLYNGVVGSTAWNNLAITEYKKVFRIAKEYGYNSSAMIPFKTKYLGNSTASQYFYYSYTFLTQDGILIGILDPNAGNCDQLGAPSPSSKVNSLCATIYVDVNGLKTPNTWGKDTFEYILTKDGLLFPHFGANYVTDVFMQPDYEASQYYWKNRPDDCGTAGISTISANVTGQFCAARIMENGWVMDY